MQRSWFRTLVAGLFGLAVAAPGVAVANTVTLYSSNPQETIETALDLFRKQHPELTAEVVRAGTGTLMQRLRAESANPLADVFWSGGFGTLGAYTDVLEPYRSPNAAAVPESLHGPDDLWTGTNMHVMVIMVNERALGGDAAPATWSDLFDPKWTGRVVMADPERSSSAYAQVHGLHERFGREDLAKLVRNVVVTPSTSAVSQGVAQGEYPLGITMDYAAHQYVAGGQAGIRLVYPTEGTMLSPEGVVLVKGAPNGENARKLYDFFLSQSAQEALFKRTFRRPSRPDVDVTAIAGLPAMADIRIIEVDQAQASAAQPEIIAMWKDLVGANR